MNDQEVQDFSTQIKRGGAIVASYLVIDALVTNYVVHAAQPGSALSALKTVGIVQLVMLVVTGILVGVGMGIYEDATSEVSETPNSDYTSPLEDSPYRLRNRMGESGWMQAECPSCGNWIRVGWPNDDLGPTAYVHCSCGKHIKCWSQ